MASDVTKSRSFWLTRMWPLLPSPTQTLLLQTCLCTTGEIDRAWGKWCKQVGSPRKMILSDKWGLKSILPLLHHSLREGQVKLDKHTQTLLRTAFFREQLRFATIRRLCRQVFQSLNARGIEAVLAGDLAIAETAYDSPALRHCGSIRLLLAEDQIDRAVAVIRQGNWKLLARVEQADGTRALLADESGLELQMASRMCCIPQHSSTADEVQSHSRQRLVDNVTICLPCWADLLLSAMNYTFIHGSWRRIEWVCDVSMLLARASKQDWQNFVEIVGRERLSWPVLAVLNYLKDSFGCCVPPAVVEALYRISSENQKACDQVAEFCAHSALHSSLTEALHRASGFRQRSLVLIEIVRRLLGRIRRTLRGI